MRYQKDENARSRLFLFNKLITVLIVLFEWCKNLIGTAFSTC